MNFLEHLKEKKKSLCFTIHLPTANPPWPAQCCDCAIRVGTLQVWCWPSSHAAACHRIGIHAELISGLPNTLLGPWSKYPTSALSLFYSACCLCSLQISIQKQSWVIICINTEINWIRIKTQCLCKLHLYPSFTPAGHSKPLTVLFLWVHCCQIGAYTSGQTFPPADIRHLTLLLFMRRKLGSSSEAEREEE